MSLSNSKMKLPWNYDGKSLRFSEYTRWCSRPAQIPIPSYGACCTDCLWVSGGWCASRLLTNRTDWAPQSILQYLVTKYSIKIPIDMPCCARTRTKWVNILLNTNHFCIFQYVFSQLSQLSLFGHFAIWTDISNWNVCYVMYFMDFIGDLILYQW